MRRSIALLAAAVLAAGSAVAVTATRGSSAPYSPPGPTQAQLAYRKAYLADQLSGDPVRASCGCTGALRAKERAEKIRLQKLAASTTTSPAP